MAQKIISNITSLKDKPNAFRFLVVFIDNLNNTEEFIFFCNSLSQCVTQCTGLINYMFRYNGMSVVYIFPTNSTTTYRTVYGKTDGFMGEYKMLKCQEDVQLTLADVRPKFIEF